jgi:hypothetical protein
MVPTGDAHLNRRDFHFSVAGLPQASDGHGQVDGDVGNLGQLCARLPIG